MPPPRLRKWSTATTMARRCRVNPLHFVCVLSLSAIVVSFYNLVGFISLSRSQKLAVSDNIDTPSKTLPSVIHSEAVKIGTKVVLDSKVIESIAETENQRHPLPSWSYKLPDGFQSLLQRAKEMKGKCDSLPLIRSEPNTVDLSVFGIINALESYRPQSAQEALDWQCVVPPAAECDIERFTVIFLGYSPRRLRGMMHQIRSMLQSSSYKSMVEEVVLVWNNPKPLNESGPEGQSMYEWSLQGNNEFEKSEQSRFRVFLPLEHGLSSTLMNRYHPMIKPKSKAILYYDDDGPFYRETAIRSNFELWKRNSNAQTGAMARAFTLSPRQKSEKEQLLGGRNSLDDRKFISHCRDNGDQIGYDFRYFENFHANMVLPSGSMIHRNYLCFIWHPALAELRKFVHEHLVHPDDMTVATIVSHLSGRAPRTYSRRLPDKRRRLQQVANETSPEGMWRTKDWGTLRSIALNSVISYFGAINSGSYGWCYKTEYHKEGTRHVCDPEMARWDMIPWMQKGGYENDLCPA